MKNKKIYALLALPLAAGVLAGLAINNEAPQAAKADNPAKQNEFLKETPYSYAYEGLEPGPVTPEEVDADGLMWLREDVEAEILQKDNNDKAMELTIVSDDGAGYARMFGIGSHGGLKKLNANNRYRIAMELDVTNIDAASEVYIEYTAENCWTGVKIVDGKPFVLDGAHVKDVSFNNGLLAFTFWARENAKDEPGVRPYFKVTIANSNLGDSMIVGSTTIEDIGLYHMDFENYPVGTKVPNNSQGPIDNMWSAQEMNLEVKENADLGHYLDVGFDNSLGEGTTWRGFYFNGMWDLVDGHKYRVSLDIYNHNYHEMYLQYNDNNIANFAYGPDGYIYGGPNEYVSAYYFDGTHLIEDITFSSKISGDWWRQVWFLFDIPAGVNFHAEVDNFNVVDLTTREVDYIEIVDGTAKTEFACDEEFDSTDLEVIATRNDGTKFEIDGFTVDATAYNKSVPGEYEITVKAPMEWTTDNTTTSPDFITTTYKVTVNDKVDSIAMKSNPTKVEYKYGEELDVTGAEITKTYRSGETEDVDVTAAMVSGYDKNKLGNQSVTVTADGCTTTFDVTVVDYDVSIAMKSNPTKVAYKYGEELDVAGAKITVTTASGATRDVDVTAAMVSGYSKTTLGEQTIKVTYNEMETSFKVTVSDVVTGIEMKSNPTKVEYKYGEELNLAGAKIKVGTASGAFNDVDITAAMVSGYDKNKLGEQTLTVTYEGQTTSFKVTVVDYITGIQMKTAPTKVEYKVNEELDVTGAKIKVGKASGAFEEVDVTAAMVSGYDKTKVGEQTLTVTYEGQTTTFTVTVKGGGCGGSIIAASSLVSVLAIAGVALISLKKKKEN